MMKIGVVTAIDTATCKCRVKFADQDGMETYWLPVLHHKSGQDKSYWMPDPAEHVCCLMDDNSEFGCILGAIYSDADQPPVNSPDKCHMKFKDGTTIEYDRATHLLKADVKGDVSLTATGTVISDSQGATTIKSATAITLMAPAINMAAYLGGNAAGTLTGTLHVTGQIKSDDHVLDFRRSVDADRQIYNGHDHPDAQAGTTGHPNQVM